MLTRYRNLPDHTFPVPGTARLRDESHVRGHARQSTAVCAAALLLALDAVATPDERPEVQQSVPDQRTASGPGQKRSRPRFAQSRKPALLPGLNDAQWQTFEAALGLALPEGMRE